MLETKNWGRHRCALQHDLPAEITSALVCLNATPRFFRGIYTTLAETREAKTKHRVRGRCYAYGSMTKASHVEIKPLGSLYACTAPTDKISQAHERNASLGCPEKNLRRRNTAITVLYHMFNQHEPSGKLNGWCRIAAPSGSGAIGMPVGN
jgi:hypothetical protein